VRINELVENAQKIAVGYSRGRPRPGNVVVGPQREALTDDFARADEVIEYIQWFNVCKRSMLHPLTSAYMSTPRVKSPRPLFLIFLSSCPLSLV
jgi:hypothetical protein